ncbi:MAG: hypothetical protein Q9211_006283, partial [Gyalolechia sp. 1 TL-2023]
MPSLRRSLTGAIRGFLDPDESRRSQERALSAEFQRGFAEAAASSNAYAYERERRRRQQAQ